MANAVSVLMAFTGTALAYTDVISTDAAALVEY
jgi:hypothetical protein